ncbi:MAG: TolC family protein [Candidatus Aminicenantes bacterium]|nr:TolC family protein [Candidatus Aminicenantes bacterium]
MKKILIILLLLIALWSALAFAAEEKILSLQECLAIALKNNIALGIKVVQVEGQEGLLKQAKEKFLPKLTFQLAKAKTNSPSYSWIEAEGAISTESQQISGQLNQALWLGGNLSLSIDTSQYESNQRFQTINPRYEGSINFTLVQPLLRGMGDRISRMNIIIAANNRNISANELKSTLLDTVYQVEELYWNLVFAERNLEAKKQALKLAEDLLNKNKKMAELGVLAEIEILSAEAETASRRAEILEARALLDNSRDELCSTINLGSENGGSDMMIRPGDAPRCDERKVAAQDILRQALANRPDYMNTAINLKSRNLELGYARNQLLPALNLNFQYWSPGLAGTQILYRDNNPLTDEVIGVIPGAVSDAFKNAMEFDYKNWAIYLSLDIPLHTLLTRGAYSAAKMEQREALLRRLEMERQIALEVSTVARSVATSFQRIQATQSARELAEKKLSAEEKRQAAGLSTSYMVLQFQRDFTQAVSTELRALCDYNLALARLEKTAGTGLEAKHIEFQKNQALSGQ